MLKIIGKTLPGKLKILTIFPLLTTILLTFLPHAYVLELLIQNIVVRKELETFDRSRRYLILVNAQQDI